MSDFDKAEFLCQLDLRLREFSTLCELHTKETISILCPKQTYEKSAKTIENNHREVLKYFEEEAERMRELFEQAQKTNEQQKDVAEVRHGEWEERTFIIFDSEMVGYRCSECNTTWDTPTKHCPNCGAKMDGGNKETEKEARWNKNMEHLKSGGFGSMDGKECYETLLRYWQAQEQAGYPQASENVKYFEEMIKRNKE